MNRSRISRTARRAACAAAIIAPAALAAAGTTTFRLADHPDSKADPPPYGLRLDGLFADMDGAYGGITTFSFSHPMADMRLTVEESESDINISIFGTAFGGEDTNTGDPGDEDYGFGEGLYNVEFNYNFHVTEVEDGFIVNPSDTGNEGSITSLGNDDVDAGTSFRFFEQTESPNIFEFRRDGFRLSDAQRDALNNPFVGRAWVTFNNDGSDSPGLQDWLFTTSVIPTPAAAGLGACGLAAGLAARRRRAIEC